MPAGRDSERVGVAGSCWGQPATKGNGVVGGDHGGAGLRGGLRAPVSLEVGVWRGGHSEPWVISCCSTGQPVRGWGMPPELGAAMGLCWPALGEGGASEACRYDYSSM